jgi:hypothetical protein
VHITRFKALKRVDLRETDASSAGLERLQGSLTGVTLVVD